jgi:hypothetical protein
MNYKANTFYILITLSFIYVAFAVHDDFGLTWDEFKNRKYAQEVTKTFGNTKYNEVIGHNGELIGDGDVHAASRGPLFLVMLNKIEEFFVQGDLYEVYKIRRLLNSLFFILSGIILLLFLKNVFKDNKVITVGFLMFFLSPRIFAHSFFNPVDIPFLSFFTFFLIALYYLTQNINFKTITAVAIISAIVTSLRVVGEISIPISLFIILLSFLKQKKNAYSYTKYFLYVVLYTLTAFTIYYAITPYIWANTWQSLIEIHNQAVNFKPIIFQILYWGKLYPSINLPWHYTLSWILVSFPTVYVFALIISYLYMFAKMKNIVLESRFYEASLFLIISIILFSACYFNYSKYNDWRHFYFIYPAFILLILFSYNQIKNLKYKNIIFIVFLVQFFLTAYDMFKFHPFQYTYFNKISGSIEAAENNFPLDYFGSSFKQGLLEVLKDEPSTEVIKVGFYPYPPGVDNLLCLKKSLRDRFTISSPEDADYFLSKWIFKPYDEKLKGLKSNLFKEIKVNGVTIHRIYKKDIRP